MNFRIKELLDRAYAEHHSTVSRERDPISLVYRYRDPRDQEVVALLAALLAYGNVRSILNSVGEILSTLGESPFRTLSEELPRRSLNGFVHRFTTEADIEILLFWITTALQKHGSLENYFLAAAPEANQPMRERLSAFVTRLFAEPLPTPLAKARERRERNLRYLVSDPLRGSACKRLNMFLRWMVRPSDGVDLGLWKGVSPSQLVLPVDTHLLQTLRKLRWTRSQQATWKVAEAATLRLREYAPEDPVRYDFALCHLSMSGGDIRNYRK